MLDLETLHLKSGAHSSRENGVCLMEAVAWMAGEPHSDAPACACPVIATFGRRWNDDLDDSGRQRLKHFVPLIVGSKSTYEVQQRRGWMAADWMVRVNTPAWLDLAGLTDQAAALRALPELTDPKTLADSREALNQAKTDSAAAWAAARAAAGAAARAAAGAAAWDAARAAAGDAAWAAARDAARDAAWAAAGAAARAAAGAAAWDAAWAAARAAAGDAARDAAWDAARAAAGDAAWDAAWAAANRKLEPTKVALQASAEDLLERMLAVKA